MLRIGTIAAVIALLVTLSGCDEPSSLPDPVASAPDEVTGVIVSIVSNGVDDVQSFVLRSEGMEYEINIADDVEYGFPLGHLNEHRATADPVVVELEKRDDALYALSIEDEPAP